MVDDDEERRALLVAVVLLFQELLGLPEELAEDLAFDVTTELGPRIQRRDDVEAEGDRGAALLQHHRRRHVLEIHQNPLATHSFVSKKPAVKSRASTALNGLHVYTSTLKNLTGCSHA